MNLSRLCRSLLVSLAVAFVLSAWLYALATIHTGRIADEPRSAQREQGMVVFFRDHGAIVLMVELVGLAVSAIALVVAERPPTARRNRTEDTAPRPQGDSPRNSNRSDESLRR